MNPLMRIRAIGLFCCLLLTHWAFSQTTRYVSTTGITPAGSATSWATSTTDLQGAINASQPGDQVWVAAGVYKPTSTTARDISFSMKNGVTIYGGFMIGQTDPGQRNVNPLTGNPSGSTLSGEIGDPSSTTDNSYHVISNPAGLTNTAVLDGFVITGGNASGSTTNIGGGMYNNGSSPTLTNCSFQGNLATGGSGNSSLNQGGAMYNIVSSPTLTNCLFRGNQATGGSGSNNQGGAMFNNTSSNPVLTNCSFQGNLATGNSNSNQGGAMVNNNSSNPVLTNCSFQGNQATGGSGSFNSGGAMFNTNSSPVLTNCSFQSNQATGNSNSNQGGAMFNATSNPVLTNCSFRGNQTTGGNSNRGGAMANLSSSNPTLTNTVVWNNGGGNTFYNNESTITARYSLFDNTSGVDITGPGNLTTTTSPFVSASSVVLAACSPAINAGNPASATAASGPYSATALPATDLGGNPRIFGARVDMGALEYQAAPGSPTRLYVAASQTATAGDGLSWATAFPDLQSALTYPCSLSLTEIWVAQGTYRPASGGSFSMLPRVAIYGGFAGGETVLSQRPPVNPVTTEGHPGHPSNTTLAGNGSRVINNPASLSLTRSAVLDGFVITGGGSVDQGGGMHNWRSSPTLTNCSFQGNQATGGSGTLNYGGAMYNDNSSSPLLTNCLFQGNQVTGNNASGNYGGAIFNGNSSNPVLTSCSFQDNQVTGASNNYGGAMVNRIGCNPTLTNCLFQGNQAAGSFSNYGGAMYNNGSSPTLTNCLFQDNQAMGGSSTFNQGGAMANLGSSSPTLTNCSFQDNQAMGGSTNQGGAMYNNSSCNPTLTNCSFQGNQATGGIGNSNQGGAMFNTTSCNPVLTNTVVWNNGGGNTFYNVNNSSLTATYSLFDNTSGVDVTGPGNLTTATSPFVSATSVALAACSPAINTGNPASATAASGPYSATTLPATDLTGNVRISNGRIDMGAIEYQQQNGVPLQIVQQPVAGSIVCAGTTVVMSVSVTGSAPAYQWYQSGTALTGIASVTTASLTLTNTQLTDIGSYSVVISGDCPSVTSTAFSLSVNALPSVTVTAAPSATLSCTNPSLTLTAQTSATAFAWSSGGSTGQTLPVSQTGVYSVTVTGANGCSAVSNSPAISRDNTSPTVSISAISNQLTCTQPQLTLTATASATALRWSTGETAATIAVSTTGVYSVTATGTNGCTAVSNNLIIGEDKTSPTVSVSALSTTLTCTQPQLTLTATASVTALRWSTGETTTTISVSQTGTYSVTATGANGCTAVSNNLTIAQDKSSPTVSVSALSSTLTCTQPQLTLTATASVTALRWSTGETTATISVSAAGTYSVTATSPNGCTVVSNNLPVTENFSLPPFTVSSATVCPGQSVNLTASGCSGQIQWSTGATTAMITLTAGNSTSLLTATCTAGICSTTASGQIVVGGIQPPPAQILSFTADESACPVRLTGRGVATSFTMTGPKDYVFSTVYREGATHEAVGLNVKQAGTYTLTVTYTNSCGTSAPVTRTVTVNRNCP